MGDIEERMDDVRERVEDAKKPMKEVEENLNRISKFDVLFLCYNFGAFFVDMGLDIKVAVSMALGYRISSIIVILAQTSASNIASWKWYSNSGEVLHDWEVAMHVLLLAPVLRCGKAMYYAWKMHHSQKDYSSHYAKLFYENNADIAYISLLEGFLEAGPQLVIQIGEWINTSPAEELSNPGVLRVVSVSVSFICLGNIMQNYHSSLRKSQADAQNVSEKGRVFMFLWHFMIEVSRVIVLILLIIMNPLYLLACIVHILLFFIYLRRNGPQQNFDNSEIWHQLLLLSLSCLYVFTAIPVRNGPTRRFYTLVYSVFALEGVVVFIMGHFMLPWVPYYFIWPLVSTSCFILGLVFMIIYHKFFHPAKSHHNSMQVIGQVEQRRDISADD